jgi:hypothetical protein
MLHHPRDGHHAFEVTLYNKDVRALVKDNKAHRFFEDRWADETLQNVVARDEAEARRLIAERYPPEAGFVVQSLQRCDI